MRFGRLSPLDLRSRGLRTRPAEPFAHGLEDCCRAMIAQAAEAIVLTDCAGTIRIWNRGAERIFGYCAAEALGSPFTLVVSSRLRGPVRAGLRRMIACGRVADRDALFRLRAIRKGGASLYVDWSLGLIRDEADSVIGAFAIGRDSSNGHFPPGLRLLARSADA